MNKNEMKIAKRIVNDEKILNGLIYLKGRWAQEVKFEDWSEYEKHMKEYFNLTGAEFIKGSKRPMGFVAAISNTKIHFRLKNKNGYTVFVCSQVK